MPQIPAVLLINIDYKSRLFRENPNEENQKGMTDAIDIAIRSESQKIIGYDEYKREVTQLVQSSQERK